MADVRGAQADLRHFNARLPNLLEPIRRCNCPQNIEIKRFATGATNGDRDGQFANAARLSPIRQVGQHIGPKQEKQLTIRGFRVEMGERIDCIVHPTAFNFKLAYGKRWIAGRGQFEHGDAVFGRRGNTARLMRRLRGWQKPDGIQPALLAATFRQQKMAVVDRIKCAAENTETQG